MQTMNEMLSLIVAPVEPPIAAICMCHHPLTATHLRCQSCKSWQTKHNCVSATQLSDSRCEGEFRNNFVLQL